MEKHGPFPRLIERLARVAFPIPTRAPAPCPVPGGHGPTFGLRRPDPNEACGSRAPRPHGGASSR